MQIPRSKRHMNHINHCLKKSPDITVSLLYLLWTAPFPCPWLLLWHVSVCFISVETLSTSLEGTDRIDTKCCVGPRISYSFQLTSHNVVLCCSIFLFHILIERFTHEAPLVWQPQLVQPTLERIYPKGSLGSVFGQ